LFKGFCIFRFSGNFKILAQLMQRLLDKKHHA